MTTRFNDKSPADVITLTFDFSAVANQIASPTVTISVLEGTDPTPSAMLSGAATHQGHHVYQRVQGGVAGATYALVCTGTHDGNTYTIEAILPVRTQPSVSTAVPIYVTEAMFAHRFGQAELESLLAEGARFAESENDGASMVNAYLSARYTLPLATVPSMVLGWVSDITRYRLWDERAPEEVRRRYDDALAQLKLLAEGVIALPPAANGTAAATGGKVTFGGYAADRVFTSDSLSGY